MVCPTSWEEVAIGGNHTTCKGTGSMSTGKLPRTVPTHCLSWTCNLVVKKGFAGRAANLLLSTRVFYFSAGQPVYLLRHRPQGAGGADQGRGKPQAHGEEEFTTVDALHGKSLSVDYVVFRPLVVNAPSGTHDQSQNSVTLLSRV
jgi:hypothetical protein